MLLLLVGNVIRNKNLSMRCTYFYLNTFVSRLFLWSELGNTCYVYISIYFCICLSIYTYQFSSVTQSCLTLCEPMNRSTPGLPVHHQLLESTQTHVHWVSDAIQPSHHPSSPSPPALNLSQHQGLFQWVSFLHQVAKVLEFQLQHQSFQWTPRTAEYTYIHVYIHMLLKYRHINTYFRNLEFIPTPPCLTFPHISYFLSFFFNFENSDFQNLHIY